MFFALSLEGRLSILLGVTGLWLLFQGSLLRKGQDLEPLPLFHLIPSRSPLAWPDDVLGFLHVHPEHVAAHIVDHTANTCQYVPAIRPLHKQERPDTAHAFRFLERETGLLHSGPQPFPATMEGKFVLQRLAMEEEKTRTLFTAQIKYLMADFLWHVYPVTTSASVSEVMKVNVITEISNQVF